MVYTTKIANFSIDSKGFLHVVFLDNQEEFDEDEARAQVEAANKLCAGISMPVLADVRNSRHVPTIEAKKIIATFPKKSRGHFNFLITSKNIR